MLNNNLKKLPLMAAFVFMIITGSNAQSNLKVMGNGFNAVVSCGCSDSVGVPYAVTNLAIDTAMIYKWDSTSNQWNFYTAAPGLKTKFSTCNFLNGRFYLTGTNVSNIHQLREFNGASWKTITSFKQGGSFKPIRSIRFSNKLYFTGGFDTVGSVYMPQVAAFNGSTFSAAGFPPGFRNSGYFESAMTIVSDSLYVTYFDKIFIHTAPNSWSVYYTKPGEYYHTLASMQSVLYAGSFNKIVMLKNSAKMDSLTPNLPGSGYNLTAFRNHIYMGETSQYNKQSKVYYLKNGKDLRYLFTNEFQDSGNGTFFSGANTLCYYGMRGVKVNGYNFNNISQVNVDSLLGTGFDTITGFVFWDKNNNYRKDGNDVWPKYGSLNNATSNSFISLGSNTGRFTDIVLDNNINIEYSNVSGQYDSCVRIKFSGNLKANNAAPGVTRDTLYFPMVSQSTRNLNLVLKNQSDSRARLVDTIPLVLNIRNKDCAFSNTANGSVKVTLDTGVVLVTTIPAYTSKVGNVITFSGLTFNYLTGNFIKLYIAYPKTKYTIGKTVRHYARINNIAGEDTMDNMDSIVQKLVSSYDPNAKYSVPEGKVTKDLKNIRYYIDFQNLGNDDAIRVTVVDTLNLKIPVYQFQMVAASHPYTVSIQPGTNIVTWVFNNINLKPKSENDAASKGYIIFDAYLMKNVPVGDSIRNRAYIYFDYNEPVITNFAVINRVDPKDGIDAPTFVRSASVKAYPNPAQDFIKIENVLGVSQELIVYDLKGARVTTVQLNGNETKKIDTENWAKGLYMIVNEKGEGFKIIIE